MDLKIIHANATTLPLEDESVDCIVTSPPYWSLREYGTEPQIWGGDQKWCKHEWGEMLPAKAGPGNKAVSATSRLTNPKRQFEKSPTVKSAGCFCQECGAWRGHLGLEPLPDCFGWARSEWCSACFVCHMRMVGKELHRVLKPSGNLFLNIGDSYAGGGRGPDVSTGLGGSRRVQAESRWALQARGESARRPPTGLKAKDLVGAPWSVALALRTDGWWLRAENIWAKVNPLPEAVEDRTTRAHEQIFHLTKSAHYFYDAKAIAEPVTGNAHSRGRGLHRKSVAAGQGIRANDDWHSQTLDLVETRNKRSWWPLVSKPFKGSHFATFPADLVEPCILAGCPQDGVVLDPFAGSGTVGEVAIRHRRHAILCDLNPTYLDKLARRRTTDVQVELPKTRGVA